MGHKRDNDGFRYEEQVIALVFLRCLRRRLRDFELTSDKRLRELLPSDNPLQELKPDEIKRRAMYDDIVVTWKCAKNLCIFNSDRKNILLVQIKHSEENDKVKKLNLADLFPERATNSNEISGDDFAIANYYKSFTKLRLEDKLQQYSNYALALSTNRSLGDNVKPLLEDAVGDRANLLTLLDSDGHIYKLNTVQKTVPQNSKFMELFFLYCGQRGVEEIKKYIREELDHLLWFPGPGKTNRACDELCERLEEWKDGGCVDPESLTSSWSVWKKIENEYKWKPTRTICLSLLVLILAIAIFIYLRDTFK